MEIELPRKNVEAEVADSALKKFRGLSLREEGKMLFPFSRDTSTSIDMALLSKPLHLYFLDSEKKVIEHQLAEPWNADPRSWKLYTPEKPYRYLLESFENLELEAGDQLEFSL